MKLCMAGIDHVSAALEQREKLSLVRGQVQAVLPRIAERTGCAAVLLATCSRTELYLHAEGERVLPDAAEVLCEAAGAPERRPFLVQRTGGEAVRHLMQVSARATKKRNLSKKQNSYAVTWSIAACLVIGIGISCYFLFLKKRMTDDVFIAKEEIPSAVFEPISPKEEISSLAETKIKQDSTHEVTATPTDKKDIVAKSKSIPKTQSAPVAITPVIEETVGRTDIQEERIVADTDTSLSEVHQLKAAKAATPNLNLIKGKVTDEKGEPIIGASVAYTGTNIGTVTDLNGEFILKKEKGNKQLTAQFIGYEPVEIPVDTSRTMLIAMNEDQQALSEVVVVGYGKKKKSNVAGATAKINLKAKEKYKTPQPVIGKRKYKKYLEENLIRPNDESCKDVKGEVVLSFFVDKKGRPQNITVVHGLCESTDKEAIRLVKEGPKWTSGDLPTRVTVEF